MKPKNIIIVIACIMLAAFALGATETMNMVVNAPVNEAASSDRLIGVLITREYLDLFDSEQFFVDNINKLANGREISESESAKYQGRLYATLVETINEETGETGNPKEYVFDGVDGICYFAPHITDEFGTYWGSSVDDAITDGNIHFNFTDEGESVSLKGTIYVSTNWNTGNFYFNPVYQSSTGEVYAVSGNSMSFDNNSTAGTSMSHTITENRSETVGDSTISTGTEVDVTISYMDKPKNITILQFNGNNELLSRMDYTPRALPNNLQVQPGTQYVVVETTTYSQEQSTTITREIYQQEDETLYAFFCRDDGICVKQGCEIDWNN